MHFFLVLALEEVAVGQQYMEDDSGWKNIAPHSDPFMFLHPDYFRGHIARGSAFVVEIRLILGEDGQSEISNHRLKGVLVLEDYVLKFYVSVSDPEFM